MNLTDRCYCLTGLAHSDYFAVNAGFVTGENETVVIDSGFTLGSAQTIYGYAQAVNPHNQVSYVINLEEHFDHILGNGFFIRKGAKIIAHELVVLEQEDIDEFVESANSEIKIEGRRKNKEAFTYFKGVIPFKPDLCINDNTSLDIGGVTIKIYVAPGHTETNLIAYCEEEKVAYVADTLYSKYLPTLRFGNERLWNLWLQSLDLLERLNPEIVVPGHGDILAGESISEEIKRHKTILKKKLG